MANGDPDWFNGTIFGDSTASVYTTVSTSSFTCFATFFEITAQSNQDMPNCPLAGKCSRAGSHSCTECAENKDVEKGDFFKPAKKEPTPSPPFNPIQTWPYDQPYAPDVYPTPYVPEYPYPPDGTWVPRKYWFRTSDTTDTTYTLY